MLVFLNNPSMDGEQTTKGTFHVLFRAGGTSASVLLQVAVVNASSAWQQRLPGSATPEGD